MRLLKGILYLEFGEMVECGVSENTLKDAKRKEANCWTFIKDPNDARKVLIDYEQLKDNYKRMVQERYGNPYEHVAREPILNLVENDWKAEMYYKEYRYDNDNMLPIDTVNKYTRGAGWLNMLNGLDRKWVKKGLGLSLADFYSHTSALIAIEKERGKIKGYAGLDILPADFPSTYQRLMAKAAKFSEEGYDALIHPAFGNKNAAKIGKRSPSPTLPEGERGDAYDTSDDSISTEMVAKSTEIVPESENKAGGFDPDLYQRQMAVIRTAGVKYNNFDAAQIAEMVNMLFSANGWEKVSVSTIRKILNENRATMVAGRQGKRVHDTTVARQVKRKVTEIPLVYWTLDGWTVELMYQQRGAKGIEYKRLVVVVVLDAWTKYPVGFAIGDRETPELIRDANRNALLHIKELFGEVYRPVQVQSDNYQIKNLTPFYQAMAHLHTPAAVGNAKSKIIEPYFKYLNKEYCQKLPNWSGFNVTASKKNQVNTEMLNKVKHTFPDRAGVVRQIEYIIHREQQIKQEKYTSTFCKLPEDRKYTLDIKQWLEVFGLPIGKTNRLSGAGLIKQINGKKYTYDSFEPEFRNNLHLDWQLYADERDLSRVLAISPDGKMRFVLEETRVIPMDVMSTTEADSEYRSRITEYNKQLETRITDQYGSDADLAREVVENTPLDMTDPEELALKVMFTQNGQQKELLQDAKRLSASNEPAGFLLPKRNENKKKEQEWAALQEQRLDEKFDFSIFTK